MKKLKGNSEKEKKKKIYRSPVLKKEKFSYLLNAGCYQCYSGPISLPYCLLYYIS